MWRQVRRRWPGPGRDKKVLGESVLGRLSLVSLGDAFTPPAHGWFDVEAPARQSAFQFCDPRRVLGHLFFMPAHTILDLLGRLQKQLQVRFFRVDCLWII